MYARLQDKYRMGEMDRFYSARRLFSAFAHEESHGFRTSLRLRPGDMIMFDNTRVLHSRSAVIPTDGERFLQLLPRP